jgi:hypothetical protein
MSPLRGTGRPLDLEDWARAQTAEVARARRVTARRSRARRTLRRALGR